jgi:sporulation protein YlmC with PRC-barrel domain
MSTQSMTSTDLEGRTVYSSDGEKLGKVDSVLTDDRGAPQYLEVRSGWFGTRRHTVPISGIQRAGDDLTLPYTKSMLESAPTFEEHEHIDYDRERSLGTHYGTEIRAWDDARDNWLAGEDLSRGPTPETRHPEGYVEGRDFAEAGETGGLDDVRDTTQGPTPETRRVMRATDDDPAAAMQPEADARTRGDVGGNQDLDRDLDDARGRARAATGAGRIRLRRWSGDAGTLR